MIDFKKILKQLFPSESKQWKVFLTCFSISFILWTLLTLSDKYEDYLNIKVEYIHLPEEEILVSEPLSEITAKVKASGFDLLLESLGWSDRKLVIDCAELNFIQRGVSIDKYWLVAEHSKSIERVLGAHFQSLELNVDTLKLRFSKRIRKKLPISLDIEAPENNGYFSIAFPIFEPDSVIVEGAEIVLNQMSNISTEQFIVQNIEENIDVDLKLKKTKGITAFEQDSVRVFIGIEPIKEFTVRVPLEVVNIPDSIELKLFPSEVMVKFNCGASQFSMALPQFFKAEVDYYAVEDGMKKLDVLLVEYPTFIKSIQIEPAKVEYIAKSKE